MNCAVPEADRPGPFFRAAVAMCYALLLAPMAQAQPDAVRDAMDDPANPLVRVDTARGQFTVELYPEAAPASVEWFLAVAESYAGQTFSRILPGVLIQSSGPANNELPAPLADRAPAPEVNATILGLEQQPLLNPDGSLHAWLNITDRQQLEERILTPLYRDMGIPDREALAVRSDEVTERLQNSTVADAYRRQGYRFDDELPSRPPRSGSVLLLAESPERSSPTIAVTLTEAHWLRGQHTVIGQVVDGMSVVRVLGSQPRRSTPPATIYRIETDLEEDGS
ncbi:MAG: peptidylprolyl isomerase [Pseudohongiellaceae bacterium]